MAAAQGEEGTGSHGALSTLLLWAPGPDRRQQVRDLQLLRDTSPGTLTPALPLLLLEDETQEGASMEK